jgi:2-polyprenyl-3-methyl-5-hydroxy-6-metoxy-1,4-benzoquinol methylase
VWTPALVERFWTGFSHTRLEELSFSRAAARPLLLAVGHHVTPDRRCLDFGAGSGDLLAYLLQQGYSAAAWEPSIGRQAAMRARFAETPGFLGVHGPDSTDRFDVVFAVEVFEHILDEQLDASLRHLARLLKPGGVLVVTTPHNEDLELGMCYCPVSNTLFHRWQHVRSFTAGTLSILLRRYGIHPIAVHLVEFNPALFEPLAGARSQQAEAALPDYLQGIRRDVPVRMAAENSILYIGRRQ